NCHSTVPRVARSRKGGVVAQGCHGCMMPTTWSNPRKRRLSDRIVRTGGPQVACSEQSCATTRRDGAALVVKAAASIVFWSHGRPVRRWAHADVPLESALEGADIAKPRGEGSGESSRHGRASAPCHAPREGF